MWIEERYYSTVVSIHRRNNIIFNINTLHYTIRSAMFMYFMALVVFLESRIM